MDYSPQTLSVSGGAVPFCDECHALLDLPDEDPIVCRICKFSTTFDELGQVEIITTSAEKPAPRWYQELAAAAKPDGVCEDGNDEGGDSRHAKVDEPCPKCGHPEMSFYTMQLRSADEGSTVFYECLSKKCGHKYSQNN
ncbi:hypothetical protein VYU27_002569 [Nannochloropsis oceanica]